MEISPSILSADFSRLGDVLRETAAAGARYVHLDVMDGAFVPNITFGAPVIASLLPHKNGLIFDAHLMVNEPARYVRDFAAAGCDIVTVHIEACADVRATIDAVRAAGVKVGLSIKPDTPVAVVKPYAQLIDLLLIMSVEPGFGGQSFIPSSIEKIKVARTFLPSAALISADGGITVANASAVFAAGADILVAGSAVYGHKGGIGEAIKRLAVR